MSLLRVVFMGSPEFAATSLRALFEAHRVELVVTQPDKRKGRGKQVAAPPVKQVAEAAGIDVYQPRSARSGELETRLRDLGADIGVVVAYGKILPLGVLEAFRLGCVNVHASILPAYRGAAPIQWAIINGETRTGVSIMALDEGMDTGPVFLTREIDIAPEDTSGGLFERLAPVGADALLEALVGIESETLTATPQDDARASYAPMLSKSDGVLDWAAPADAVCHLIRGVDPWPGAQTCFGDVDLKLFGAFAADGAGAPGEVLRVDAGGMVIACGVGACGVRELQPAGSRRMPAIECARGRRIGPGAILGVESC